MYPFVHNDNRKDYLEKLKIILNRKIKDLLNKVKFSKYYPPF